MIKILQNKWLKNTLYISAFTFLFSCSHLPTNKSNAEKSCVDSTFLYEAADKRLINQSLFETAIACKNTETVEVALVSLGRIGGKEAADLISSKLNHDDPNIRATAAFALGISLTPEVVPLVAAQLEQETNESVQEALALAIGNLGHEKSADILYELINTNKTDAVTRGAMQGLGILALFHRDKLKNKEKINVAKIIKYLDNPKTSLQASFLLARIPLLNVDDLPTVKNITNRLDSDSQAFAIRAIGNLKQKELFSWLYKKAKNDDIGIRVSAIQALGKIPELDKDQVSKIRSLLKSQDTVTKLTVIQSASRWLSSDELTEVVDSQNSWLQAEAFAKLKPFKVNIANDWLNEESSNLQKAASNFFEKQNDKSMLQKLAQSNKAIIANGAQRKLEIYKEPETQPKDTPKKLASLPKRLVMKTTKGDIAIKLFSDTPYTSDSFVKLAKTGFYDGTYFHRVIPNFVAQGGSRFGDGSGNVDYSIREELNQRSHRFGTIGMATVGKDTAGGQFFINLAPNLHLDSNYTVFGEVVSGMDIALKLEQNDQVISIEL